MIYQRILKPILFQFDAEKAHHITTSLFSFVLKIPILSQILKANYAFNNNALEKELWGVRFKNPVGLAAGFDKDGKYYESMQHLGFGFIEIGTVTPKAQDGNPKKRLFRLPKDSALINRMGFNNEGVDTMVERLKKRKRNDVIIGGNIGKNKITPNDQAVLDYEYAFEKLYDLVDYFVINVSSPNTPGLRELQDKEPLTKLVAHIIHLRNKKTQFKPVLLKIAPDLTEEQLTDIFEIIKEQKLDGIIATNTTIDRSSLNTADSELESIGNGGLSGAPLTLKARDFVRTIRQNNPNLPIIGVGGISTVEDAHAMLDAGADLIQIYTGLVYQGPSFVKKIKKSLI